MNIVFVFSRNLDEDQIIFYEQLMRKGHFHFPQYPDEENNFLTDSVLFLGFSVLSFLSCLVRQQR